MKYEPDRYLLNAKDILSKKAKKDGKFYTDAKYVRMACNTAYNGLLLALNELFKNNGIDLPKKRKLRRMSVDVNFYQKNLTKINKKKLKEFNSAYNHLHLLGGYDGELSFTTIKFGMEMANSINNWIKTTININ